MGSATTLIKDLIKKLQATFPLKHLSKLDYFLGFKVKYHANGFIILIWAKYIWDLFHKASMIDCKGVATPMASTTKISKFGTDKLSDPNTYRSLVGALQYVTLTQLEIAYVVNKVC